MADLQSRVANLEAQVRSLQVNHIELARRIRTLEKYVDTVSSPIYKRLFWVLQGYRLRIVGRWYRKTKELQ